jgi:hypothetical protein
LIYLDIKSFMLDEEIGVMRSCECWFLLRPDRGSAEWRWSPNPSERSWPWALRS